MNIGVDIDGVLTDLEKFFLLKGVPYFQKKFNKQPISEHGYDIRQIFDCTKEEYYSFWRRYFLYFIFVHPARKEAVRFIKQLRQEGFKIFIITKRIYSHRKDFIGTLMRMAIKIWLFCNRVKYHRVVFCDDGIADSKLTACTENNIQMMIEDEPVNILALSKTVEVFCYDAEYNKSCNGKNIVRVQKFEEIYKMLTTKIGENMSQSRVNALSKALNIRFYGMILTELFYALTRSVLCRSSFSKKLNPIICGAENILKGHCPVVFVGNHRNKLDPVITAYATKRRIHWAALLRMFQGKENLFSMTTNPMLCWASALFITMLGAKPVARTTDKNFAKINKKTFLELGRYLDWGGAIGIYPEGTINRNAQQENLHRLKSSRAFKMAVKHGALVQPVATVWIPKRYKIPNRVMVVFSPPINTVGMTVSDVAEQWHDTINLDIEKIKRFIEDIKDSNSNRNPLVSVEK